MLVTIYQGTTVPYKPHIFVELYVLRYKTSFLIENSYQKHLWNARCMGRH